MSPDIVAWYHEYLASRLILHLDCTRTLALQIVQKLRGAKLFVEVWGPGKSPAQNGRIYPYYVQLAKPTSDSGTVKVEDVIGIVSELAQARPTGDDSVARLRSQIEELKVEKTLVTNELRTAQGRLALLEPLEEKVVRLKHLLQAETAELERIREEDRIYRARLSSILARAAQPDSVRSRLQELEQENASLRKRVSVRAREVESYEELLTEAQTSLNRAQKEREQVQRETDDLRVKLARLEQSMAELGKSDAPDIVRVMSFLLPNLEILPESFGYIFRGIRDQNTILEILARLNQDHRSISHKSTKQVQSTNGRWFERHFSTGHGDEGRLYYSKPDSSGRRLCLVAPKDDQKDSVRKLQIR